MHIFGGAFSRLHVVARKEVIRSLNWERAESPPQAWDDLKNRRIPLPRA